MIVLGIDPGPTHCGIVHYDTVEGRTHGARKDLLVADAVERIRISARHIGLVAIERVQSYGIAGGSLLRTSEVVGRLWQVAEEQGIPTRLLYRREVLRALAVTGKGNRDSLIRARLIEMHGGTRKAAQGLKKQPGPLYGVSGHAWQALAVAVAAADAEERAA